MYTLTFDLAIDSPFWWLLSNILRLIVPIALPQESKRTPGGGMFYLVLYLITVDQLAEVARLVVAEITPRNIKATSVTILTHSQAL
jgi:hypothetical protein